MEHDGSPFEFYKFKSGAYDFWRCYNCHKIFTYEEEHARKAWMAHDLRAAMCPCRSLRYKPAMPSLRPRHNLSPLRLISKNRLVFGNEWLEPSVLTYTLKLALARGVAPWLEIHYPKALPFIEKLVVPSED